jgi:hypothetical protein
MFRHGIFDENGLEKTCRRRNGKTGFGVQKRENGREKGRAFQPVFPSTSHFSSDQ